MCHPDCSNCDWRYDLLPNRTQVLGDSSIEAVGLLNSRTACRELALDTRYAHEVLFRNLVPDSCRAFAGNYRGSERLSSRGVMVPGAFVGDHAGFTAPNVASAMEEFAGRLDESFRALDALWDRGEFSHPDARHRSANLLIQMTAYHFWDFLRIHPYADGNGHAGRFLVRAILARYGYQASRFTVEPRPLDEAPAVGSADQQLWIARQVAPIFPYTAAIRVWPVAPEFLERLLMVSLDQVEEGNATAG